MVEALVEYDYDATEDDELTIKKGDLITNIEIKPGGWWEGTLSRCGKRGMFPDNYVKVIDDANISHDKESELPMQASHGKKCKVLFSYKPANEDELELNVGDIIDVLGEEEEGWWRGKLKNQVGVFPSNFVTEMDSEVKEVASRKSKNNQDESLKQTESTISPSEVTTSQNLNLNLVSGKSPPQDAPSLPPKPSKEMCRVLFPYEPLNDDELALNEGDLITLISKDGQDVGWWKGELRGKVGVFPDNFVQLVHVDEVSKPERPSKMPSPQNKVSSSNSKQGKTRFTHRKLSDGMSPEDKVNPPSVSKKPTLPPPPLKKPSRRPGLNELSKSSTSPSLSSVKQQASNYNIIPENSSPVKLSKNAQILVGFKQYLASSNIETGSTVSTGSKFTVQSDGVDGGYVSKQSYTSVTSNTSTLSCSSTVTCISPEPQQDGSSEKKSFEFDLDSITRRDILTNLNAARAKAPPNRRLPTGRPLNSEVTEDIISTEKVLMNGNVEPPEKSFNKVPWVEELKLSQAKKTSQGKTRVTIGPLQTETIVSEQTSNKSLSSTGVTLRSQPVLVQRPYSMFTSSKIVSTTPPDETVEVVSMKKWNELVEKVTNLEDNYKSINEALLNSLKELTEKLNEERKRRIQMEAELEKLTNLVTQV